MKLPFNIPLNLPLKLAVKPAMKLVGKFLQSLDKNKTGGEDVIGVLLERWSESDHMDEDIAKFAAKYELESEPAEPAPTQ